MIRRTTLDTNEMIQQILEELSLLIQEERMEIFRRFCHFCGTDELPCCCWRDE